MAAPREYGSEQKRAAFLSSLGSQLFARARLRVDVRRLYRGGGSAARELLALAAVLQRAAQPAGIAPPAQPPNHVAALQQSRSADRARAQQLAGAVTAAGQQLIASLAAAPAITQQLDAALATGGNSEALRAEVLGAATRAQGEIATLQRAIAELDQEQQSLEGGWCAGRLHACDEHP